MSVAKPTPTSIRNLVYLQKKLMGAFRTFEESLFCGMQSNAPRYVLVFIRPVLGHWMTCKRSRFAILTFQVLTYVTSIAKPTPVSIGNVINRHRTCMKTC